MLHYKELDVTKFNWGGENSMWKTIGICIAALTLSVSASLSSLQAAEQGTETGGMVGFHGVGKFQQFEPDFGLWNGEFWGESTTDSESGPMHRGAWYCTGEQAFQGGVTKWGGGYCTITDVDGDTVNLRWQATAPWGPGANIGTRGDYFSGTGKYTGITGWYTFHCENVAMSHFFCSITGGEYSIP